MKSRFGWVIFFLMIFGVFGAGFDANANDLRTPALAADDAAEDGEDNEDNDEHTTDDGADDDFGLAEKGTIAAGGFEMGCEGEDGRGSDAERLRHTDLPPEDSVDRHDATNALYAAYLNAHGNDRDDLEPLIESAAPGRTSFPSISILTLTLKI